MSYRCRLCAGCNHYRQRDCLGGSRRIIRLVLKNLRQRVHGKRHGVKIFSFDPNHARRGGGIIERQIFHRQIPAGERDRSFFTRRAAERKNAGDIRQFAQRDPINEILAAPKN